MGRLIFKCSLKIFKGHVEFRADKDTLLLFCDATLTSLRIRFLVNF